MGVSGSLIVLQVALSLVLVVAAGLFVRTFTSPASRDLGFRPEPLLAASVDTQPAHVEASKRLALYEQVREAASSVPGVASAAVSAVTPLSGSTVQYGIVVPGMPERSQRDRGVLVNIVTSGWFATYSMRLASGRDVAATDLQGAPGVAVVNQEFVRRFLAGQPALGRVVRESESRPGEPTETWEIVGVVNDAVYQSLREPRQCHDVSRIRAAGEARSRHQAHREVRGRESGDAGPGRRRGRRTGQPESRADVPAGRRLHLLAGCVGSWWASKFVAKQLFGTTGRVVSGSRSEQ
jgi:hypothetical protein